MELTTSTQFSNCTTTVTLSVSGNPSEDIVHGADHAIAKAAEVLSNPCLLSHAFKADDCAPGQGTDTVVSHGSITLSGIVVNVETKLTTRGHILVTTAKQLQTGFLDAVTAVVIKEVQQGINLGINTATEQMISTILEKNPILQRLGGLFGNAFPDYFGAESGMGEHPFGDTSSDPLSDMMSGSRS